MKSRALVFLSIAAVPLLAAAGQPSKRGACEYRSENPKEAKLTFCTPVANESLCAAEASKKGSPEWIKLHPPKFSPGADCMGKKPVAKRAKRASAEKGQ
jgi:hypothetical protein